MTVNGTALSTSDYTVSGMNITIPANKITGNVVITVATEKVNTGGSTTGSTTGSTGGTELTKIETKEGIVSANSALGATVQWGVTGVGTGTSTKYLIPAGMEVTIKVTNTGNYAFARTNMDEMVIDICISQSLSSGEYTFGAINSDTYLFTSDNKILSIESEITNDYIIYPVEFKKTGLIASAQTIGSEISIADQSGVFYNKYFVPAGKSCKIKIKGGGNYGMVLTDLNNVVVEFTKSISSNDVSVITEYSFGVQENDCYFYAALNKFDSFF